MFQELQLEVLERFSGLERYFEETVCLRAESEQTARGLVFVQIYAIHEFTTINIVRLAGRAIAGHYHAYADLRPSLLALFLDPKIKSLMDCSPKRQWESRLELFELASSSEIVSVTETPLPMDGTHFRHSQLQLILRVLGVDSQLTIQPRQLHLIDQVVSNRNEISHGSQTAAEIGRRYSRADIQENIRQIKDVCLRLILITAEHCSDPTKHLRT